MAENNPGAPRSEFLCIDPRQETILSWIEFSLVLLIAVAIAGGILGIGIWVLLGYCHEGVHHRLVRTMVGIDNHWKGGLLILVPLLYRPIRIFALQIESAWGLNRKASPQPSNQMPQEPLPNPVQEKK